MLRNAMRGGGYTDQRRRYTIQQYYCYEAEGVSDKKSDT